MIFNNLGSNTSSSSQGPGPGEPEAKKLVRIALEMAKVHFLGLVRLGRLFAGDGAPLAELVKAGKAVPLPAIYQQALYDGGPLVDMPLDPKQMVISLQNKQWKCPSCGSAHGTAMGASNKGAGSKPSTKGLALNEWYYSPAAKRMFVISNSCYET